MKETPSFPEQQRDAFHLPDTQLNVAEARAAIEDSRRDIERVKQAYAEALADLAQDRESLKKAEEELEKLYGLLSSQDVHAKELRIAYDDVRKWREWVRSSVEQIEEGKRLMEEAEREMRVRRELMEGRIRSLLAADAKLGELSEQARTFPRNQA